MAIIRFMEGVVNELTMNHLSKIMRVDARTIARLARDGRIPAMKRGRQWRFSHEKIRRWGLGNYKNSDNLLQENPLPHSDDLALTPAEVSLMTGVSVDRLKVMLDEGVVPGCYLGREPRFWFWAIVAWTKLPYREEKGEVLWDMQTTADFLRVPVQDIELLVQSGTIPHENVVGTIFFRPTELEKWLWGDSLGTTAAPRAGQKSAATVEEIATMLGLNSYTVDLLARCGILPARHVVNGIWRFSLKAVESWTTSVGDNWHNDLIRDLIINGGTQNQLGGNYAPLTTSEVATL
jgi:excisionase family DNA binding protein